MDTGIQQDNIKPPSNQIKYEDYGQEYKKWRISLRNGMYGLDVDAIEWRYFDGVLTPVAVLETTSIRQNQPVNDNYLNLILSRFDNGIQSQTSLYIANALNVKAYIVAFRRGLEEFWIYNLTDRTRWYHVSKEGMIKFLERQRPKNV